MHTRTYRRNEVHFLLRLNISKRSSQLICCAIYRNCLWCLCHLKAHYYPHPHVPTLEVQPYAGGTDAADPYSVLIQLSVRQMTKMSVTKMSQQKTGINTLPCLMLLVIWNGSDKCLSHCIDIICSLYQCSRSHTKHILVVGPFRLINFLNNFMCNNI